MDLIKHLSIRPSTITINSSEKDIKFNNNFTQAMNLLNKIKNCRNSLEDNYFKSISDEQEDIKSLIFRCYEMKIDLEECNLRRNKSTTAANYIAKKRRIFLQNIIKIENALGILNMTIKPGDRNPIKTDEPFKERVEKFCFLAQKFKEANNKYEEMVNSFLNVINNPEFQLSSIKILIKNE